MSSGTHPTLHYADYFTHGIANSPVIDLYYKTIPDEHFPWKSTFKGVPNWAGMRLVLHKEYDDISAYYSDDYITPYDTELTAALIAAAAVLPEHQTISETYNQLQRILYEINWRTRPDDFTPPLSAPMSGDTEPDTLDVDNGGIFSVEQFDSPVVVGKLELLKQLGYKEVSMETEVHNPDLTRVFLQSDAYPEATYVYEFTPEGVMSITPKLSNQ